MNSHKPLFSFIIFLVLFLSGQGELQAAEARSSLHNNLPTKLFIFGDSYVDAGNTVNTSAWYEPYGITWPGKPSGRFSNGRVFSDFLAEYLELQTPVPYELRGKYPERVKYGMNFAYGGTGVFDTNVTFPNMTVQIDHFQNMIQQKVYSPSDLTHSVAYVSVAGNDYVHYLFTHNSSEWLPGLSELMSGVVNQTKINLNRIQSLGVRKVAVGGLHPVGCIPGIVSLLPLNECILIVNWLAQEHNKNLQKVVNNLNQQAKINTTFLVIDHYDSFESVLNHPRTYNIQDNPLTQCLVGSNVDGDKNNYTVCDEPRRAFFWDGVHPTQAGWHAVYTNLRARNVLQPLKE